MNTKAETKPPIECSFCGLTYDNYHIWTSFCKLEICEHCLTSMYNTMVELREEQWK